jgi:SAM-dependent methyltransferase
MSNYIFALFYRIPLRLSSPPASEISNHEICNAASSSATQLEDGRPPVPLPVEWPSRPFALPATFLVEYAPRLKEIWNRNATKWYRLTVQWHIGMNYFAHQTAAERYAQSRPYFHPLVIDRIRAFLALQKPLPVAVDVGCGTGQSALALTKIAEEIIAADIAPSMLAQAPAHPKIRYVQAPAERLPLKRYMADLMTVSLAFHWLDRARFLNEAHRVIRPGGALAIYNNSFYGQMHENPDFSRWNREHYLTRYPTPCRNNEPFADDDAREYDFIVIGREPYTNDISFTPDQLVRYLMTQTNVIDAVEQGGQSPASVYTWLLDSVSPLFRAPTATFQFGGEIWHLQSSPST